MTENLLDLFISESTNICEIKEDIDNKPSAEDLLRENIKKANQFLDMALQAVSNGTITSLWIERVSKLIDSITAASERLITAGTDFMDLEIKRDLVSLKTKELELKTQPGSGVKSLTQNVFNMTREDAIKLLRDSREDYSS